MFARSVVDKIAFEVRARGCDILIPGWYSLCTVGADREDYVGGMTFVLRSFKR